MIKTLYIVSIILLGGAVALAFYSLATGETWAYFIAIPFGLIFGGFMVSLQKMVSTDEANNQRQ